MKRYALFAAILLTAACGTEDDSDSGDDVNPTGASSAGPTTDPTGSGETGDDSSTPDTSDDDDPTSDDEGGESSGGLGGSSGGAETSGAPDSGGSGACESFNDMTPYYGDVQVDSFCWTAGLYYACGETAAGDETCAILSSFANDGGAACPYC
jgi:hypothetical protein